MSAGSDRSAPPPGGMVLPGLLVEPAWLRAHLGAPDLRIVDLREPDAHAEGHVPGALSLELAALGRDKPGLENVLLPPEAFAALMSERGISNRDTVDAYDDQWGLAAARFLWALHCHGHDRAAVLNGGWDRWLAEGAPVEEGAPARERARFEPHLRADGAAETEWIASRIGSSGFALLDTRTPAEFAQGHLPGALSWDWFRAVPEDSWNVAREPEALLAEWGAMGLHPADEVVVYCRSGMRAAHTWLVLRHAGFERVRLYDGSWQAWAGRGDDAPDETAARAGAVRGEAGRDGAEGDR